LAEKSAPLAKGASSLDSHEAMDALMGLRELPFLPIAEEILMMRLFVGMHFFDELLCHVEKADEIGGDNIVIYQGRLMKLAVACDAGIFYWHIQRCTLY
jgi:hypothetical protein